MQTRLNRLFKDQSGITALETAIILIAFVVVAAVFAFTILSTGTFLTEKSKEAAYSGLQEVRGSMELRGSVLAKDTTATPDQQVDEVWLTLAPVTGGASVDLSTGANAKIEVLYRDSTTNTAVTDWTVESCGVGGSAATDCVLAPGQLATLKVPVPTGVTLGANSIFAIEIKPPTGGTMTIERTLPAKIDPVVDLH